MSDGSSGRPPYDPVTDPNSESEVYRRLLRNQGAYGWDSGAAHDRARRQAQVSADQLADFSPAPRGSEILSGVLTGAGAIADAYYGNARGAATGVGNIRLPYDKRVDPAREALKQMLVTGTNEATGMDIKSTLDDARRARGIADANTIARYFAGKRDGLAIDDPRRVDLDRSEHGMRTAVGGNADLSKQEFTAGIAEERAKSAQARKLRMDLATAVAAGEITQEDADRLLQGFTGSAGVRPSPAPPQSTPQSTPQPTYAPASGGPSPSPYQGSPQTGSPQPPGVGQAPVQSPQGSAPPGGRPGASLPSQGGPGEVVGGPMRTLPMHNQQIGRPNATPNGIPPISPEAQRLERGMRMARITGNKEAYDAYRKAYDIDPSVMARTKFIEAQAAGLAKSQVDYADEQRDKVDAANQSASIYDAMQALALQPGIEGAVGPFDQFAHNRMWGGAAIKSITDPQGYEVNAAIQQNAKTLNLAAAKLFYKGQGNVSNSERSLVETANGDIASARTAEEYVRRVQYARMLMSTIYGVQIPSRFGDADLKAMRAQAEAAAQKARAEGTNEKDPRWLAAAPPETKIFVGGQWLVKTPKGDWIPDPRATTNGGANGRP